MAEQGFGGGGEGDVGISAFLDPQTVQVLSETIEKAVTAGFKAGFNAVSGQFAKTAVAGLTTTIEKGIKEGFEKGVKSLGSILSNNAAVRNAFKNMAATAFDPANFSKITAGLKDVYTEVAKANVAFQQLGLTATETTAQIRASLYQQALEQQTAGRVTAAEIKERTTVQQQQLAEQLAQTKAALTTEVTERRAALDSEGRAQRAELDQQTIAASTASKTRIAQVRATAQIIVNVEKQVAEAVKSLISGTGTVVGGVFKGIGTVASKTASGIGSVFKRSNEEVNAGLRSTLSTRESLYSSSFEKQTQIVRENTLQQSRFVQESITKQTAAIEELRLVSSRGPVGAVKNLALGAGFLGGGIAVIQAARSTFTVGSETIRGLAVLQAQLGLTAEQMATVRQVSIDLGNDISLPGVSALDASAAIAVLSKQFGSLGAGAVTAAEQAAKGTLQLARATGATAEEASVTVGAAVNVFKVAASDAVEVADQITGALTFASGTTFPQFADAFRQGAASFAALQVPVVGSKEALVEFNVALAALAKQGLSGQAAGTGLARALGNIQRNTKGVVKVTSELVAAAGETGTVLYDVNGKARVFADSIDILRRATAGMTQQQKATTLIELAGLKGYETLLKLINTSSEDYANLGAKIREQGLAAKIAAAQNTGFKGALDALQSVVETVQILFYEKVNPALGQATLFVANLANKIFFSNGAWAAFRDVIKVVGIGLGVIIAYKGAVQVVELLGKAGALAVEHFGPLPLIIGALAGGLYLLSKNSKEVSEAFNAIGDRLAPVLDTVSSALKGAGIATKDFLLARLHDLVAFISGTVAPAVARFINFVLDTGIPTLARWGQTAVRDVVGAFHAVVRFFDASVMPIVRAFVDFVTSKVVPAAKDVGSFFVSAFRSALGAVQDFWQFVKPFLQPAIDGFVDLGHAIGSLFDQQPGGKSVISTVLGGLGSAGAGLGGAFANIGTAIYNNLLKPLGEKVFAFLKGIFTVDSFTKLGGFILDGIEALGRFLGSHVDFITEWAVKIGIALTAAAVIIAGKFAIGFIDGLADSLPRLAADIGSAFVDTLKGAFSGDLFSTILLGAAAFGAAKLFGSAFAKNFITGFKGALKSSGDFLGGFLGGPQTSANAAFGPSQRSAQAFQKELQGVQNQLRILGSPTTYDGTTAGFKGMQNEAKILRGRVSDATYAGLQLRDRLSAAFSTFQTLGSGVAGVFKAVGIGATQGFGQGAAALKSTFTSTISQLRTIAQSQGKSLGSYLGKGLAVGLAAALGGFIAGRAEGKAGVNPLLSGLTAGLTGAAIGGPIVGALSGVAAGIGSAFGNADKARQDFEDGVHQLADAIRSDLGDALKGAAEDGKITFEELGASAGDALKKIVTDSLPKDIITQLNFAGVGAQDLIKSITETGFQGSLRPALEQAGFGYQQVNDILTSLQPTVDKLNQALKDTAALGQFASASLTDTTSAVTNYAGEAARAGVSTDTLSKIVQANADYQKEYATAAQSAGVIAAAQASTSGLAQDRLNASLKTTVTTIGTLNSVTVNPKVDAGALSTAIGGIQGQIDTLNTTLDIYAAKITEDFQVTPPAEQLKQEAIANINSAVGALASAVPGTQAAIDAQNAIAAAISSVVVGGIKDGTVTDVASAQFDTLPLWNAVVAAVATTGGAADTQASLQATIADQFNTGFANAQDDIQGAAATAAEAVKKGTDEAALQALANGKPIGENVLKGIADGINDTDLRQKIIDSAIAVANDISDSTAFTLSIDSPSKVMYALGAFAGEGLALGLADSTRDIGDVMSDAVQKAVDKAQTAADTARLSLQKTFGDIFGQIAGSDNQLGLGGVSGTAASSAIASITGAVQSFLSTFQSNVDNVFEIAAKQIKGDPLSLADQNIVGESVFSLSPADIIGSSNLSAIQGAFDAVAKLGQSLISQGLDPSSVAGTLRTYVDSISQQAVALGFNSTAVDDVAHSLGVAADQLDGFVLTADQTQASFERMQERLKDAIITVDDFGTTIIHFADGVTEAINKAGQIVLGAASLVPSDADILAPAFPDAAKQAALQGFISLAQRAAPGAGLSVAQYLAILLPNAAAYSDLGVSLPSDISNSTQAAQYAIDNFGPDKTAADKLKKDATDAIKAMRKGASSDLEFLDTLSVSPGARALIDALLGKDWTFDQAAYEFLHDSTYEPDNSANPDDSGYRPTLSDEIAKAAEKDAGGSDASDLHNEHLPTIGTTTFNIYPPTQNVEALALSLANKTAYASSLPGG